VSDLRTANHSLLDVIECIGIPKHAIPRMIGVSHTAYLKKAERVPPRRELTPSLYWIIRYLEATSQLPEGAADLVYNWDDELAKKVREAAAGKVFDFT